jgi:hypothetical protein
MAHRRGPRSPQRSIRGGIGRRPRLRGGVEEGPPSITPEFRPDVPAPGPWGMAHGGKVELFQDQVMRKFGGGSIKAKKSGGKIKTKKK